MIGRLKHVREGLSNALPPLSREESVLRTLQVQEKDRQMAQRVQDFIVLMQQSAQYFVKVAS